MEFSLEQIWNLRGPLAELAKVPMSATAGYRIETLLMKVQPEFDVINEQRLKLVKQACVDARQPDAAVVPPEALPKFYKEFAELLGGDKVDLPVRSVSIESVIGNLIPRDVIILVDCGVLTVPGE